MLSYLLLNGLIICIPLLLSFEHRVYYVGLWPAVFLSILVVGGLYVLWDAYVTKRGDWRFNKKYLTGYRLFGLPIEEILFFVTAPFSCIFIYEAIQYLVPLSLLPFHSFFYILVGMACLFFAWRYKRKDYTRTVMTVTGISIIVFSFLGEFMLATNHFWITMGLSFIAFYIFNGYLTGIPIVIYNPEAITGRRIKTIPIEDFFYNFAMLGSYFLVYFYAKDFLGL